MSTESRPLVPAPPVVAPTPPSTYALNPAAAPVPPGDWRDVYEKYRAMSAAAAAAVIQPPPPPPAYPIDPALLPPSALDLSHFLLNASQASNSNPRPPLLSATIPFLPAPGSASDSEARSPGPAAALSPQLIVKTAAAGVTAAAARGGTTTTTPSGTLQTALRAQARSTQSSLNLSSIPTQERSSGSLRTQPPPASSPSPRPGAGPSGVAIKTPKPTRKEYEDTLASYKLRVAGLTKAVHALEAEVKLQREHGIERNHGAKEQQDRIRYLEGELTRFRAIELERSRLLEETAARAVDAVAGRETVLLQLRDVENAKEAAVAQLQSDLRVREDRMYELQAQVEALQLRVEGLERARERAQQEVEDQTARTARIRDELRAAVSERDRLHLEVERLQHEAGRASLPLTFRPAEEDAPHTRATRSPGRTAGPAAAVPARSPGGDGRRVPREAADVIAAVSTSSAPQPRAVRGLPAPVAAPAPSPAPVRPPPPPKPVDDRFEEEDSLEDGSLDLELSTEVHNTRVDLEEGYGASPTSRSRTSSARSYLAQAPTALLPPPPLQPSPSPKKPEAGTSRSTRQSPGRGCITRASYEQFGQHLGEAVARARDMIRSSAASSLAGDRSRRSSLDVTQVRASHDGESVHRNAHAPASPRASTASSRLPAPASPPHRAATAARTHRRAVVSAAASPHRGERAAPSPAAVPSEGVARIRRILAGVPDAPSRTATDVPAGEARPRSARAYTPLIDPQMSRAEVERAVSPPHYPIARLASLSASEITVDASDLDVSAAAAGGAGAGRTNKRLSSALAGLRRRLQDARKPGGDEPGHGTTQGSRTAPASSLQSPGRGRDRSAAARPSPSRSHGDALDAAVRQLDSSMHALLSLPSSPARGDRSLGPPMATTDATRALAEEMDDLVADLRGHAPSAHVGRPPVARNLLMMPAAAHAEAGERCLSPIAHRTVAALQDTLQAARPHASPRASPSHVRPAQAQWSPPRSIRELDAVWSPHKRASPHKGASISPHRGHEHLHAVVAAAGGEVQVPGAGSRAKASINKINELLRGIDELL